MIPFKQRTFYVDKRCIPQRKCRHVSQIILRINTLTLIIACTHASVVSAIVTIICNEISNLIATHVHSMTSVTVLFAHPIRLNISTRELQKFYRRSCIIISTDHPNAIKNMFHKRFKFVHKISFHKRFKFVHKNPLP